MKNDSSQKVKTIELVRTSQSWDGVELPDYLQGKPEIVGMKYEIPAGQEPVILYMFYLSQTGLPLSVQQ